MSEQPALLAEGKTKVVLAHATDPNLAVIRHKDDITAGDGARRNTLPGKGALSGRTTANCFRVLTAAGIPTHFVSAPAADEMIVRRCTMIPIEVVTRRIATGSYLKRNPVAEGTRFDPTVVEFFFKDDANHDPLVTADWIAENKIATPSEIAQMAADARRVFSALERAWATLDVQLVDLKIEFGRTSDGAVVVADVIDNDSWRIWPGGDKNAMLDKQVYRNITEVTDEGLRTVLAKYIQVADLTDEFTVAPPSAADTDDKPVEKCGVFGVWGASAGVVRTTLLGLMALQHRGQESAGIGVLRDNAIHVARGMGRVDQIFKPEQVDALDGADACIGHTRYSTTGGSCLENAQPVYIEHNGMAIAMAHNGNIVNPLELRDSVLRLGGLPTTSSDTELLAWLILLADGTWEERIKSMIAQARGAYALTILTPDAIYAVRDPHGLRPLCIGWRNTHWLVASESCALDTVGAELVREVEPGEVIRIDANGLRGILSESRPATTLCVFEKIYFARPDSVLDGTTAFDARVEMGRQLAIEHPANADIVIGVPDSGVPAAIGYAQQLGVPLSEGLVKNRYVGRTFIQPDDHSRQSGIRLKFNPLRGAVTGKRVVVVDDSVVRGNTMPKIVELLRRGGAIAVHLRVSAPPISHPCYFGIDMGEQDRLIAHERSMEEIRQHLGVDTLGYLSLDGLKRAVGERGHCFGCITGHYPVPIDGHIGKLALERQADTAERSPAKQGG